MSETQHTHNPLATAHKVVRNGVEKILTICTGKRDAWKDKPYQAAQIETDGTDSLPAADPIFLADLAWWGKTNVKNALNTIGRRYGQDFVEDATGDEESEKAGGLKNGIFSLEKFLGFWTNLKSSAMRLSELNEAYQAAVNEYKEFTSVTLIAAFESGDAVAIANAKAKMATMTATLNSLKADFEERKARRSKEAATETTSPE
jgi:hypothetical protein